MAVQMKAKDIIFGTLEVSFGIAALAGLATIGGAYAAKAVFRLLIGLGVSAPIVPVLMRWSLKYWQSGSLPKVAELVVCIWAIVWWILAAIMMIAGANVRNSRLADFDAIYVPATFALVAGIAMLIDLILGIKSK